MVCHAPEEGVSAAELAERAVLGCLLIDCGLRVHIKNLRAGDFSDPVRATVFSTVMGIDGPVDLIIAVDKLEHSDAMRLGCAGWAALLGSFMDNIPSVEHIEEYAKIVRQCAIERRLEARTTSG